MMPAGRMISWSELASIRVSRSSSSGLSIVGPVGRAAPSGNGEPGKGGSSVPSGIRFRAGTLQAGASVTRREKSGQTRSATSLCTRRTTSGGARGQPLYCPSCDPTTQLGCLLEIVETLVLTLVIFFVIQTFVAQPYKVQQKSMEHTLEPDQYVLVDKLTPRFDTYKRGDIVVFTPPPDWVQDDGTPFIKRVIGLGGDNGRHPRRPRLHQRHRDQRAVPLRRTPVGAAPADDRPGRPARRGSSRRATCS